MKKAILALALVATTFGAFAQQTVKKETASATKTEIQKKEDGVKKHHKNRAAKAESKKAENKVMAAKKEVKAPIK
ncbi:hypothetical protein [Olivibacter domesticus]|uniref:Uncharacterized protein n=1 Tax=Olivibacter domesticus TaxID=407022 RepID=A0A1H7TND4_OLID1|nr:hypothetical protein [Olivibacter domesticus]SEL85876.1 hypothetical protein SAMN05661044_03596 [Olivibacter domesticus]